MALFTALLLCATAAPFVPLARGQQGSSPSAPTGTGDNQTPSATTQLPPGQTPQPNALPGLGQLGQIGSSTSQTPSTNQAPLPAINPKTGLPWTPEELHEREIDKFDPMKRDVDFSGMNSTTTTDTSQSAQQSGQPQSSRNKPLPGSVAAMNADAASSNSGGAAAGSSGGGGGGGGGDDGGGSDYSGPAVLSRSYTLSRPMVSSASAWAASLSFGYSIDDGQEPTATSGQNVQYQSVTTRGLTSGWSISGRHHWKRDQLGLSYNGNYSDYTGGYLSGLNHSLNLDYSHVVSSRIMFSLVESGLQYSQNYSLENPALDPAASIANINLSASPTNNIVTGVMRQSSSSGSMTYHQTARLSYNLSGSYFITGRTGGVGMWGHQFGADANYRWTSKMTVGAYYSYTNYLYAHGIGNSDSQGGGAIFSYAFNRRMQLQTRIGAARIESLAYTPVPLPQELAVILGEAETIVNAYSLRWTSDISAQLVRDLGRNQTVSLAYAHGQSPGNGVLLTSVQQTMSAGFSTSLMRRRLPLSVGFLRSQLEATLPGQLNSSTTESFYVSTSRAIGHGISSTFSFAHNIYNIGGTSVNGSDYRISVGLSWGVPENIMRKL